MNLSKDFDVFKLIHRTLVPASFWIVARARPSCLKLMKFMAKVCCKIDENKPFNCTNCGIYTYNELDHRLFLCSCYDAITTREQYFSDIHNTFGLVLCNMLLNSTSKQFIMYIFGHKDDLIHSELDMNSSYADFIIANAYLLLRLYA